MSEELIEYLRASAVRLREVATKHETRMSAKLRELADEFEIMADELEAERRHSPTSAECNPKEAIGGQGGQS
jgi:hypothetical protein